MVRAQMILQTAAGNSASRVAGDLGVRKATVLDWVRRFREGGVAALADAERPGRPQKFDEAVRLAVAALAVDDPAARSTQRNRWTVRALATEFEKTLPLAPKRSTVWSILREAGIRTNRSSFWLFSRDPNFEAKVNAIASLLADPPADELVLSIDEKTSIQALERLRPNVPPQPGKPRRIEHGYKRHGTVDLIAAYAPTTGDVFGLVTKGHDHQAFGYFLTKLFKHYPEQRLVLVMDNLSVHKHNAIKAFIAAQRGRVRVLFTPTHASWINPVESWFSVLGRRLLRDRSFESKEELADALYDFIDYWDEHDKRPLRWRFRGFPTPRRPPAQPSASPIVAAADEHQ